MKNTTLELGRLVVLTVLTSIGLAALPGGAANLAPNQSPGQSDSRTTAFTNALGAAGFIVQEGGLETVDLLQNVNDHVMCSAQANNAGQFYKRLVVPPHPYHLDRPNTAFRLKPDEAVVYVGKTPPRGDYFSYVGFLFTRHYPDSVLLTGDFLLASVGDPSPRALLPGRDSAGEPADDRLPRLRESRNQGRPCL